MSEPHPRPWFWLFKSEPDAYSIDDLKRDRVEPWNGVRNFAARNKMREMKRGEFGFFYHSSCKPPGVVGLCKVAKQHYPDPTQFDPKDKYFDPKSTEETPRWSLVDVRYVAHFPRMVTLEEIKNEPDLADMVLVKRSRLSVQPVTRAQFEKIVAMGGGTMPKI